MRAVYSNASTRDISVALADFRNVAVTAGLLSFRATQARALSCSPLLPSGSKSRNTRSIGFPSRASKSIGFRRRKNIPNVFSISENRAWGMATPSPTPVEPSCSRLDNSASICSGSNRTSLRLCSPAQGAVFACRRQRRRSPRLLRRESLGCSWL